MNRLMGLNVSMEREEGEIVRENEQENKEIRFPWPFDFS